MGQKRPVSNEKRPFLGLPHKSRNSGRISPFRAPKGQMGQKRPVSRSCAREEAALFGHEASRGTLWSRCASCRRVKAAPFWARGLQGTLWSRRASCGREKAAPFGHEASRAHFGHAAPLAEEKRRHLLGTRLQGHTLVTLRLLQKRKGGTLLGTRLPGHTLVTPRLLRKRKGGTFWARGFQGTLWSRRASCRREKAAPFGHEASAPHSLTKTAA